jgi:CelD/BcsL family acetyltransferase involved in cellulose biosynthesis
MRISVVDPRELGMAELARWRALQEASPSLDNPFLSPEFTATVAGFRSRIRVAVLEEGPDIVGFFAFEDHTLGIGTPVAAGLTDAQGLVMAAGLEIDTKELLRACSLNVFEFDHLVSGQPLANAGHDRHPSPVIDLAQGFEAYTRTLLCRPSKTYKATLANSRKLERAGTLRHEYGLTDREVLRVLLGWKTDQYRRTGRMDRFARRWIVELVERLLATRTDGFAGVLDMLYLDDRPVAGHFGLRTRTRLAWWFPAYDTAFAKFSPGRIQHLAMAEKAAASGIRLIDLGRGQEEYKDKLKTGEFHVAEGRVVQSGVVAGMHWVVRAPVRKARQAVLDSPPLRKVAAHTLKAFSRFRPRWSL